MIWKVIQHCNTQVMWGCTNTFFHFMIVMKKISGFIFFSFLYISPRRYLYMIHLNSASDNTFYRIEVWFYKHWTYTEVSLHWASRQYSNGYYKQKANMLDMKIAPRYRFDVWHIQNSPIHMPRSTTQSIIDIYLFIQKTHFI